MDDSDAEVSAVFGRTVVPPLGAQATGVSSQDATRAIALAMSQACLCSRMWPPSNRRWWSCRVCVCVCVCSGVTAYTVVC